MFAWCYSINSLLFCYVIKKSSLTLRSIHNINFECDSYRTLLPSFYLLVCIKDKSDKNFTVTIFFHFHVGCSPIKKYTSKLCWGGSRKKKSNFFNQHFIFLNKVVLCIWCCKRISIYILFDDVILWNSKEKWSIYCN